MDSLTVSSALISPNSEQRLTPAMIAALWAISDALDKKGISAKVADAVWLDMPSHALRGEGARQDNVWLRECLDRLQGLQLKGEYRGDPWGAVMIAEYHIAQNGTVVRLLIPPGAIQAIRAPETFAKIEYNAAFRLGGPARRLYAALADKKRMRQKWWEYSLDELRTVMGVEGRKSYYRWQAFRKWVILPAIDEINDYGTVTVKMTPQKTGRSVTSVRFDWQWKTIDEARITDEENERHQLARHRDRTQDDAPPLMERTPPTDEEKAAVRRMVEEATRKIRGSG